MAVTSAGICILGLIRFVLILVLPSMFTLTILISTIRSVATLMPVVSRSKKASGRVNINSISDRLVYVKFFEIKYQSFKKLTGQYAIDDPVVMGDGKDHYMPDSNRITSGCFNNNGSFFNDPYSNDGSLW